MLVLIESVCYPVTLYGLHKAHPFAVFVWICLLIATSLPTTTITFYVGLEG